MGCAPVLALLAALHRPESSSNRGAQAAHTSVQAHDAAHGRGELAHQGGQRICKIGENQKDKKPQSRAARGTTGRRRAPGAELLSMSYNVLTHSERPPLPVWFCVGTITGAGSGCGSLCTRMRGCGSGGCRAEGGCWRGLRCDGTAAPLLPLVASTGGCCKGAPTPASSGGTRAGGGGGCRGLCCCWGGSPCRTGTAPPGTAAPLKPPS